MTTDRERRREVAKVLADHLGSLRGKAVDTIQRYSYPTAAPEIPMVAVFPDDPFLVRDDDDDAATFCGHPTTGRYVAMVLIQGDNEQESYDLLCEFATTAPQALSGLSRTPGYNLTIEQALPPARANVDGLGAQTPQNLMTIQILFSLDLPETNF